MSARRLRWDELPDAHRAVYRDQWAAEREVADWFSLPSLTWEQERAALMAGRSLGWMPEGWVGMGGRRGHRRDVATEGPVATNCACESVREAAEAKVKSEDNFVDLCVRCNGAITVLSCAPDENSGANCTCKWTCGGHHHRIDASDTTCSQENDITVPPCPPLWSEEYEPLFGGSGTAGSTSDLCFTPGECGYPDLTLDPGIQALPSYVDIQVESFTGRTGTAGTPLASICGAFAHDLSALLALAFRLVLANADIVKYALCIVLPPDSDADLSTPGVQPMQSVLECMCSVLEGRRLSPITLSVQPTGACSFDGELSTEYESLFGEDADVDAWTYGDKVAMYVGYKGPPTTLGHDRATTALREASLTFRRDEHVDKGVVFVAATLAHELLHVCGFRHLGVRGTTDITAKFTQEVHDMLAVRYSVVGDL